MLAKASSAMCLKGPGRIIHIGHSYGPTRSTTLVASDPSVTDGLVLTGYTNVVEYFPLVISNMNFIVVSEFDPTSFPANQHPNGYLIWSSKHANQYSFLAYPEFDIQALHHAEATEKPFAMGVFVSPPRLNIEAPEFMGPVLCVNAEEDLIICVSGCNGLVGEDQPRHKAFPASAGMESIIVPRIGHGHHTNSQHS